MDLLKKYGILIGKFGGLFLIGSLILSVLEYLFLNSKLTYICGLIYLILVFMILSYKEAKKSNARGFVTGLKIGGLFILILLLMNLIFFQTHFKFLRLIYYLILLFASLFGAIIGVNSKKQE